MEILRADDGIPQGALGFVVGGGQVGVGDEGGDRSPVVENLAGECPDLLGVIVAVALAGAFQAGEDRVDDACARALGDLVDEAAHLTQKPRPEVRTDWVQASAVPLRIR